MIVNRMGVVRKALLAVMLVFCGGSMMGCQVLAGILQRESIRRCEFDLEDVQIEAQSALDLKLKILLGITNPNPYPVIVDRLAFDLFINNNNAGKGSHEEQVTIQSAERQVITLDFQTTVAQVGAGVLSSLSNGQVLYRLKGHAFVETESFGELKFPLTVEDRL